MPVVAAGGGEGDICEENGLRRVGQRVKEALAGEVLRVGCVRLAEAEETAVCVCAAVGPLCSLSCFAKASRSASDDAAPAVAWVCRMLM